MRQTCYHGHMFQRIFLVSCMLCLLGQGCLSPLIPTKSDTSAVEPIGDPSPEGLVMFREGFGKLPGTSPLARAAEASLPGIVLAAPLPSLPNEVTVLREWNRRPEESLLRNLTSALTVPPGTLGEHPVGTALELGWTDESGVTWTYSVSSTLPLAFSRRAPTERAASAADAARLFLTDRGVNMQGWGDAVVEDRQVRFAATRDRQTVVDANGEAVPAAIINVSELNAPSQGQLELNPVGLDRSNYPSFTEGETLERLRVGGTHPLQDNIPGSVVTFTQFSLALYRHDALLNGVSRTFYLPALWAIGTVRRPDGSAFPYATTVPLVRGNQFAD
jgi:hypothetical protein